MIQPITSPSPCPKWTPLKKSTKGTFLNNKTYPTKDLLISQMMASAKIPYLSTALTSSSQLPPTRKTASRTSSKNSSRKTPSRLHRTQSIQPLLGWTLTSHKYSLWNMGVQRPSSKIMMLPRKFKHHKLSCKKSRTTSKQKELTALT